MGTRGDANALQDALAEQQRDLEKIFGRGRDTPARGPVVFSEDELARIEQVRAGGNWLITEQQHEYLDLLQDGGRLGDPLPAAPAKRRPYIAGIADDFEVRIVTTGDQSNVVLLFSHDEWPGVRFGHRFPPPDEADEYEEIWLKEEIETCGLGRLMGRHPDPDADGIIWTDSE